RVVAFDQLRCHFATGLRELFPLAGINPTLLSPRAMLGYSILVPASFDSVPEDSGVRQRTSKSVGQRQRQCGIEIAIGPVIPTDNVNDHQPDVPRI
ncbi:hypothetical protein AB4043_22865, partial [Terriglobus sp. YAF25]|uniref:hypothetical protein n=1 Tax=Terriglobus sp. YAF25 TaxID=3233080 RepID=UPI003F9E7B48